MSHGMRETDCQSAENIVSGLESMCSRLHFHRGDEDVLTRNSKVKFIEIKL